MKRGGTLILAVVLGLAGAGVAMADVLPVDLNVTVITGDSVYTYYVNAVEGTMTENGTFSSFGSIGNDGFSLDWALSGDLDPVVTLAGAVTAGANPTIITISSALLAFPVLFPNETGGSISGSLTDTNGDGATVSTVAGTPLYTAFLNGAPYETLHDDPWSESVGAFGSGFVTPASFGNPIPSLPGPPATSMQIGVSFLLSPFDQFAFTSNFVVEPPRLVVIPEPASMTLLGIGLVGMAMAGRRRSLRR